MIWQPWLWVALWTLGVALAAYSAGRRFGRQEGERLASVRVPIALRSRALVNGRCPLCGEAIVPSAGSVKPGSAIPAVLQYGEKQ